MRILISARSTGNVILPTTVTTVLLLTISLGAVTGLSLTHFRNMDQRSAEDSEDAFSAALGSSLRGSATSDAVTNNRCCDRQPRKHFVGYGLDGEQLFVDMGQCRQSCSTKKTKIHRREFEAILKANTSVDPVELFLSMQRDESAKSCSGETHHCLPTRTVIERHMTMSGLQQVAVIEDCACVPQITQYCHRVEENVVHFQGTPFETTIDVGRCSGSCTNSGTGCRSIQNKTVSIPGPNGDTCIEVIEKCSCTSACYRASSMEHVYDYTLQDSDGDLDELTGAKIKVIDVGKCVGECSNSQAKQHCVLRDTEDETKCLMSLTRRENNCVPLGFEMHRYRNRNGSEKSLLSITDCGCQ